MSKMMVLVHLVQRTLKEYQWIRPPSEAKWIGPLQAKQWGFVISMTIRRKRLETLKLIKYCKELKKSSKYWIKKETI